MAIRLKEIRQAAKTIRPFLEPTPMVSSQSLSLRAGIPVFLKLENLQKTGSFKVRGAFNRVAHLTRVERERGVVAASAGNHAQGVALAARTYGISATIIMPEGASIAKQEASRSYGGRVILHGRDFDAAMEKAREIEQGEGKVLIHAFDDEAVIAGQGTLALEILKEQPDIRTILVPVGGGGIASGIAIGAISQNPKIQVIGVVAPARPTLADGIAVKSPGRITQPLLDRYLDRIIPVDEDEIAEAILILLEQKRIIAEGAGAVALAALMKQRRALRGPVCLMITGGNIDVTLIERIIDRGLVRTGRLLRFSVRLPDRPGALAGLSVLVGELGANILHIVHDRLSSGLPITQSRVDLSLETRGREHSRRILARLKQSGYPLL
jgi:threonine dehydratase